MIAIVQKTTVWYLSMAVSKQSASKESVDDLVSRVLNYGGFERLQLHSNSDCYGPTHADPCATCFRRDRASASPIQIPLH